MKTSNSLRRIYADWAEGNFSTTGDCVDPEIDLEWVGTSFAEIGNPDGQGRMRGLQQLDTAWRDWLKSWERFTIEAREFIELDDDRVVVLYRRRGRLRGTDSPIEEHGGSVWTFREGVAAKYVDFYDRSADLEAVGLSE